MLFHYAILSMSDFLLFVNITKENLRFLLANVTSALCITSCKLFVCVGFERILRAAICEEKSSYMTWKTSWSKGISIYVRTYRTFRLVFLIHYNQIFLFPSLQVYYYFSLNRITLQNLHRFYKSFTTDNYLSIPAVPLDLNIAESYNNHPIITAALDALEW